MLFKLTLPGTYAIAIMYQFYIPMLLCFLLVVNTHKKSDKKPDSPGGRHRTSRQSSIPSSIPSPKQGSLSSGNNITSH